MKGVLLLSFSLPLCVIERKDCRVRCMCIGVYFGFVLNVACVNYYRTITRAVADIGYGIEWGILMPDLALSIVSFYAD